MNANSRNNKDGEDNKHEPADSLLDAAFLRRLERLALAAMRATAGRMKGANRSVRRGTSVEFADYREYAPGDDLRYVDWNTVARSEKMFLKLFVEEEDLALSLLLDTSKSMAFGAPAKLRYAAQIAAALGYIGLANHDHVSVQPCAGEVVAPLSAQRGKAALPTLFSYLQRLEASGTASFADSLRRFAASAKHKGVAVVLSDFFDAGWQEGLQALLARGFQVTALHLLAQEEMTPGLRGDLRLLDSETGEVKEVSLTPQLLARYQQALSDFCGEIEVFCHRHGVALLRVSTVEPVEAVILKYLRQTKALR